jgi:N-acetylglucosamine transport system permease protein
MQKRGRTAFIVSFLAPATALYLLFVGVPLLQAFQLSLFEWKGVSNRRKFLGFQNFQELGQDNVFWQAMRNNLWLIVGAGIAIFVIGIAVALAMQGKSKAARGLKAIILFPQIISLVVVAIIWMYLYNPNYGLVTGAMKAIGLPQIGQPLGTRSQALPAVGIAFLWYVIGFYVMLFSAGLRNIPEEIGEAASLDGSTGWHRFQSITWPLLWSVKKVAAVYIVVNVMNVFALVYLMTAGGPDRSTEVMLTYLYEQAFKNNRFGYATALAIANFVVAMGLSGLVLMFFRKNPEGQRA